MVSPEGFPSDWLPRNANVIEGYNGIPAAGMQPPGTNASLHHGLLWDIFLCYVYPTAP